MPAFNRERRLAELLRTGHAVLLIQTWDTPGVLAAGKAFAEALGLPALIEWDSSASEEDPNDSAPSM